MAFNSSQVSGLTDDSSSEAENDPIVLEPPTAAADAANLPPSIASVWEHPLVRVIKVPVLTGLGNQKTTWRCLAPGCGKEWSGANSSKALAHGSRDKKFCLEVHVKACKGNASQAEMDLFCSLLKNRERKKTAVKRANDLISEDIVSSQGTVSDGILQKIEKSRGGGSGVGMQTRELQGSRQIDLLSSFDKNTVSGCNSADLDAAIAQLVYCKALPFSFGECPYFQRVIDVARSAPRGYKPPKRGLLAGEMLDLAYTTQLERDLKQLMIDADIFGIAFFGDGATIHKCPLINLLYRTFGSGSNHKPYAFFMQHSKTYNKGRRVGLLRSAELKAFITRAANDVKDKTFWKQLFFHFLSYFGVQIPNKPGSLGSGGAEQGWSDNKEVKSGKRSHLSSDKLRKQGTLYTSANIRRACIKRDELEKPNCELLMPSGQFDLGLEKWGVNIEELKKPLGPRRVFKCWVEDWENVMDKGDVMRTKFLVKYGGLVLMTLMLRPLFV
ncbi:hypothetical protein ACHAW5_002960 [Stephanodiscus triporus]|uniref:Uncharacterized protein n=1 Tax=Stephanodiscus triporus TaxID=2934178 RepID=A0ABD3PFP0_9STRA